ncbi:Metal transporter nramp1 [Chlorella vulgaris]
MAGKVGGSREGSVATQNDEAGLLDAAPSSSVELTKTKKTSLLGALSNRVDSTKQIVSGDPSASASKLSEDGGNDVPPPVEVTPAGDSDDVVRWSWRRFLLFCGPGLLMSVAYLDPGNLEADIQAGAKTGFALLWWFLLVSMGCGTAFQLISGKLGLVTGKDLAQHCGEQWPLGARWFLWAMLEFAIVAVDI